jgi:hypothetical protein
MERMKITAFWDVMLFSFVRGTNISEEPAACVCHDRKVKMEASGVCKT